ncbi:MAG: CpsD/CapB family tyrosine-protein kinase [Oscillospiraceae bacterium]|jgi:capsular exopolysaccharide synthesis family protein|nr:CpsD/CapB family tyrosine-protein kinase [Oscillospiraceae bacterium]
MMSQKEKNSAAPPVETISGGLIDKNTPFTTVEEYKMLRTAVTFAAAVNSGKCKIIGITSPLTSDGKSVTCMNLAVTFAMTSAKVLLVDCDLRKPVIAQYFSFAPLPGISNVIAGTCPIKKALREVSHNGATFDVITSGDIPPNPSELLGSEKAEKLFAELAESYDYIFVDLPPTLVVSDPIVISKLLSGLIIVVRSGQTKRADVKRSLDKLKIADANVLGFVLNGIPRTGMRRYYTYRHGYGYGYGHSKKQE